MNSGCMIADSGAIGALIGLGFALLVFALAAWLVFCLCKAMYEDLFR